MTDLAALPDFDNPPVAEVVLGVQFQAPALSAVQMIRLYERNKGSFPGYEAQPPLPPEFEILGPDAGMPPAPSLMIPPPYFVPTAVNRLWFVSDDGNRVIQTQPDRLIFNWRRRRNDDKYPRYSNVLAGFRGAFKSLMNVLNDDGINEVIINQCEVLYFNPIVVEDSENIGPDDVTTLWSGKTGRHWQTPLSDLSYTARYILRDRRNDPAGRLMVNFGSLFNEERKRVFQIDIRARGRPAGGRIEDAMEFFDLGHAAIVTCFTGITTPLMHQRWGLKNA